MSEVARRALVKLLTLAENALSKRSSGRGVNLKLSEASFPEYLALPSAAEKTECNTAFRLATRAGAIEVEWDLRAEPMSHATKLVLRDADALADHLGIVPRWRVVSHAQQAFASHLDTHPVLNEVLECWNRGVSAQGTKPGGVEDWLDAIRVFQHCVQNSGEDVPVRRLSARLFGNSKRIEALWPQLDALQQGTLAAKPLRDAEEVFAQLGLVKFPPTLLLAMSGELTCRGQKIRALQPYMGVPPKELQRVAFDDRTSCLMSIENLTTFHELALRRHQRPDVAIVYTGGMPSPSWLHAHRLLLDGLPASALVYHWGDIDAGGFRIAAHIANTCAAVSRKLHLHSMVAPECPSRSSFESVQLTNVEVRQIQRLCSAWGWADEAAALSNEPNAIEQEALALNWPK